MNESIETVLEKVEKEAENRGQTLERLLATADASKVFSAPVKSGEYTVITAAEVGSGGGFGSGMGFGSAQMRKRRAQAEEDATQEGLSGEANPEGFGGGGGGGGGSGARPVAAIVIGPEGVVVRPIIDVRRLALTALFGLAILGNTYVKLAKKR
jgi:uncharacterized spore protein YtfJ